MWVIAATDNHIGYMEKDSVRHQDSLEAFEEVLKAAKAQNVSVTYQPSKYAINFASVSCKYLE